MKKYWFKAKEYGWGWYPATREGWLVLVAYAAGLVWIFRDIDATSHSGSDTLIGFFIPFVIISIALILVCWKTGERPSWRWAGKPVSPSFVLVRVFGVVALAAVIAAVITLILSH